MKNKTSLFLWAIFIFGTIIYNSCEPIEDENINLTLQVDKTEITADSSDVATLKVFLDNGNDVTSKCIFHINESTSEKSAFCTKEAGKYVVKAEYKESFSGSVTIKATEAEEITGTLKLKTDKVEILADNEDKATLTVTLNDTVDVSSDCSFTINGENSSSKEIITGSIGEYKVKAIYKGLTSNEVVINAVDKISTPEKIAIKADKAEIMADGVETVTFSVFNNNDKDITAGCSFYVNGVSTDSPTFSSTDAGTFKIKARYKSVTSEEISITVNEVKASDITLTSSQSKIFSNGTDYASLKVMVSNGNDITSACTFEINGKTSKESKFTTTEEGIYTIKAKFKDITSNSVTIEAEKAEITFEYKLLIEQYTATWCKYCPLLWYYLKQAEEKEERIVPVVIHGSSDIMMYQNYGQLMNKYEVKGYPTGILRRKDKWNYTVYDQIEEALDNVSPIAIALENKKQGNNVSIKVKVKMGKKIDSYLGIIVMVLENKIKADQANYYNDDTSSPLYGMGNPIKNFEHNHTLRVVLTDLFAGDEIPDANKEKGMIYEKTFSADLSNYTANNCEVVAFVVSKDDGMGGIENAQSAGINDSVDFHKVK